MFSAGDFNIYAPLPGGMNNRAVSFYGDSLAAIACIAPALSYTNPLDSSTMAQKLNKGDVNGIPIISLAPFIDGSNKQAVADAMLDSFKTVGFVYLVDHGLHKDKIAGMFDWVRV